LLLLLLAFGGASPADSNLFVSILLEKEKGSGTVTLLLLELEFGVEVLSSSTSSCC